MIIPDKLRTCLKSFVEWGGFAGVVCYLIEGQIIKALVIALLFGLLIVLWEKYFNKFP